MDFELNRILLQILKCVGLFLQKNQLHFQHCSIYDNW